MMFYTDLSIFFWDYVLETTAYILNRVPSKSIPSTLYKLWNGRKPSLKHLKIWGYPAYVKNIFGHKLSAKSDKCLFVRYPKRTKGYYFYHPIE